jgi:hypothetical protein
MLKPFKIKMHDVIRVRIGNHVLYLKAKMLGGVGHGEKKTEATTTELQATDEKGEVHIITLCKADALPDGWKESSWTEIRKGELHA